MPTLSLHFITGTEIFGTSLSIFDFAQLSAFSPNDFLSEKEKQQADKYKYRVRKQSYVYGRLTGKFAINALHTASPQSFSIVSGIFTQPVIEGLGKNLQVSLTHSDELCAAIAFPEVFPMGIDTEAIDAKSGESVWKYLSESEKKLIPQNDEAALSIWTAKESLSKATKTGLTVPLHLLAVKSIQKTDAWFEVEYANFGQYKAIVFKLENQMVSICYPIISALTADSQEHLRKLIRM